MGQVAKANLNLRFNLEMSKDRPGGVITDTVTGKSTDHVPLFALREVLEALLFNEKDIEYNVDKWKNGEIKTLFILGFIGSGKTVTSKYLSKEYNCISYALDDWRNKFRKIEIEKGNNDNRKIYSDFIFDVEQTVKNTKERLIIEGIDILFLDRKLVFDNSVIIKGTSLIISTYRAWIRNRKLKKEDVWFKDKSIGWMIKDLIKNEYLFYKQIKEFLKELNKIDIENNKKQR